MHRMQGGAIDPVSMGALLDARNGAAMSMGRPLALGPAGRLSRMSRYTYGGQALIEGVLMRGRDAIAVALRHPDGRIVYATERLDSGFHGTRWSKLPLLRGLVVLYETLIVGTRWLVRSANVQAEEDGVELGKGSIALMLGITLVLGIGIFFLLPLLIATFTAGSVENDLVQHLVEGLVRVIIFLGYLTLISRMPDIHRVFQYHGAEHMTIHALEANDPLTVDAVRKYPTAHQRCGTEFLVVVILLSIIAFSLVGRQPPLIMVGSRLLLVPVIAAIGYEILKAGARHRANPIVKVLMYPGILVQMITTKRPTDDMIEVAIVSMQEALVADGETVPTGSAELEHDPMRLGPLPTADSVTAADDTLGASPDGGGTGPIVPPTTAATASGEPPSGS
jgi:uncharacterized protein YqhQ